MQKNKNLNRGRTTMIDNMNIDGGGTTVLDNTNLDGVGVLIRITSCRLQEDASSPPAFGCIKNEGYEFGACK